MTWRFSKLGLKELPGKRYGRERCCLLFKLNHRIESSPGIPQNPCLLYQGGPKGMSRNVGIWLRLNLAGRVLGACLSSKEAERITDEPKRESLLPMPLNSFPTCRPNGKSFF